MGCYCLLLGVELGVYYYLRFTDKTQRLAFAATWMDLEMIILSKVNYKEKDKYHMLLLKCGIQNMTQMNSSTKQKQAQKHPE